MRATLIPFDVDRKHDTPSIEPLPPQQYAPFDEKDYAKVRRFPFDDQIIVGRMADAVDPDRSSPRLAAFLSALDLACPRHLSQTEQGELGRALLRRASAGIGYPRRSRTPTDSRAARLMACEEAIAALSDADQADVAALVQAMQEHQGGNRLPLRAALRTFVSRVFTLDDLVSLVHFGSEHLGRWAATGTKPEPLMPGRKPGQKSYFDSLKWWYLSEKGPADEQLCQKVARQIHRYISKGARDEGKPLGEFLRTEVIPALETSHSPEYAGLARALFEEELTNPAQRCEGA